MIGAPNSAATRAVVRDERFVRLGSRVAWRLACPLILLSLVFGLGGHARAAQRHTLGAANSVPSFAIADLDGDHRPDLADIETGRISAALSDYSIQLQLSRFGREAIQLVAPTGGLAIEARDVDGNHTVDLIVTTIWSRNPVAVFVNNGHGSFSRLEPGAFPGAFCDSSTGWTMAANHLGDAVGVPPQPRSGFSVATASPWHIRGPSDAVLPASTDFLVVGFLNLHAGRSPPQVSQL